MTPGRLAACIGLAVAVAAGLVYAPNLLPNQVEGRWIVSEVAGATLPTAERWPVRFKDSRMDTVDGCNSLNARYRSHGARLKLDGMASTLVLCTKGPPASRTTGLRILSKARRARREGDALILRDDSGATITLTKAPEPLKTLTGTYRVCAATGGYSTGVKPPPMATFLGGRIFESSGCKGSYQVQGEQISAQFEGTEACRSRHPSFSPTLREDWSVLGAYGLKSFSFTDEGVLVVKTNGPSFMLCRQPALKTEFQLEPDPTLEGVWRLSGAPPGIGQEIKNAYRLRLEHGVFAEASGCRGAYQIKGERIILKSRGRACRPEAGSILARYDHEARIVLNGYQSLGLFFREVPGDYQQLYFYRDPGRPPVTPTP